MLCEVFGVHRSSYKYWLVRDNLPSTEQLVLQEKVREAHELSCGSAGARTISDIITQDESDITLSRYRASKLMKNLGLVSCQLPLQHAYKKAAKEHVAIPNLLARQRYIIGYYYSQVRPHQHNDGLTPNKSEDNFWLNYKTVANLT